MVRVCWECLAEPSVKAVFNSRLRESVTDPGRGWRHRVWINPFFHLFSKALLVAVVVRLWCLQWWKSSNSDFRHCTRTPSSKEGRHCNPSIRGSNGGVLSVRFKEVLANPLHLGKCNIRQHFTCLCVIEFPIGFITIGKYLVVPRNSVKENNEQSQ